MVESKFGALNQARARRKVAHKERRQITAFVPSSNAPRSTLEFVSCFKRSEIFAETERLLRHKSNIIAHFQKTHHKQFTVSAFTHVKVLIQREFMNSSRDKQFTTVRVMQCILMGLINGGLFFRIDVSQWILRFGPHQFFLFMHVILLSCWFLSQGCFSTLVCFWVWETCLKFR